MNTQNDHIPLGKAPRRVRGIINQLLATKQLTPEGLKWLIVATDPFHDEPINCDGFPDLTTSSVLTQTVQLTTSVSRPSTVPSTDLWDCHVFLNPCSPPLDFSLPGTGLAGTDASFYQQGLTALGGRVPLASAVIYSGFNAVCCPVGTDIFSAAGGQVSNPYLAFPQSFCSGYFRLIACGFEVVNTTAELYKGGSVTVYRSPAFSRLAQTYGTTLSGPVELTSLANLPPGTQTAAALFPTSRTWGASDGVYVVPSLNSDEIPFVTALPAVCAGLVSATDVNTLTTGSGQRLAFLPQPASFAVFPATARTSGMNSPFPFDISGAVFSGLNPNSTLQVTVKYVIERIPSTVEPTLLVLTRQPCPYDPMAIELYTRVMAMIPVGVKVSENPDGEFWASILEALALIAPVVGTALTPLTGPLGPALGAIAGTAASAGGQAVRRKIAAKAEKNASRANPQNNSSKKN